VPLLTGGSILRTMMGSRNHWIDQLCGTFLIAPRRHWLARDRLAWFAIAAIALARSVPLWPLITEQRTRLAGTASQAVGTGLGILA
jgi:hypothetical protein